jgi:hypothetical protein
MALGRTTRLAVLIIRLSLGIVLLFCTTLIGGVSGQLAFSHVAFAKRCLFVLLSLFFALQAYAVCRILLFRRRAGAAVSFSSPPGLPPDWFGGALVPAPPSGPHPTLAAAEEIPNEKKHSVQDTGGNRR